MYNEAKKASTCIVQTNPFKAMTTKEKALKIFESYYTHWENNAERNSSGYDYERTYVEMMQKFQAAIFQHSVGQIPRDKNVKKNFKPVLEK